MSRTTTSARGPRGGSITAAGSRICRWRTVIEEGRVRRVHWMGFAAWVALTATAAAQTVDIAARVSDEKGQPIADAVVVAVPVDGLTRAAPRAREAIVDQVNKEF